jgi:cobalt-zinc-cadmium resistance protein CzcA
MINEIPLIDTTELELHPLISYYDMEYDGLASEKKRIKAYAMPELTLGYQNQSLTGVHSVDGVNEYIYTASDRFHSAQIGIDIPIFYSSTKRKLATLDLYQQQNNFNKDYIKSELEAQLNAEILKYNSYLDAFDLYQSELLVQADEINEQAKILLQSGEISTIDFIQMKQFEITTRLDYLSTIHAVNQSQIKLMWYVKK